VSPESRPTADAICRADHESVAHAVVTAVAKAEDVSPVDLDPLAAAIDPDALTECVTKPTIDRPTTVEFRYYGYDVTVSSTGDVSLVEHGAD